MEIVEETYSERRRHSQTMMIVEENPRQIEARLDTDKNDQSNISILGNKVSVD